MGIFRVFKLYKWCQIAQSIAKEKQFDTEGMSETNPFLTIKPNHFSCLNVVLVLDPWIYQSVCLQS